MDSAGLLLQSRRRDLIVEVDGKGCELTGEAEWVLTGPQHALTEIQRALGTLAEPIGEALLLSFGNAVGVFDLPHLGRVDVVSGKWTRRNFDDMLAELTAIASALPFRGGEPAALPYDRTLAARKDLLYSVFVYLRHILSDSAPREERLLPALSAVLADPHRRLMQERISERLERARGLEPRTLERLASSSGPVSRASGLQASAPIARALHGHIPERVEQHRSFSTFDTAENRFVKSFLQTAEAILDRMEEACRKERLPDPFTRRILIDCQSLRRTMSPVVRHRMWEEVGPMVHLPASSTVLQRRRGYRQVFQCFSRLRLAARVPFDRELVRRLLEARNVAELYELWCFFKMARAVGEILGPPARADAPEWKAAHVAVSWDFRVAWPDGTSLAYNRCFHPADQGSYSVLLRPDITLELPGTPPTFHLFDAKFRLQSLALLFDDQEERSDVRGKVRKADLYKMHTYRDAISGAGSVWALYPGSEACFFGPDFTSWSGSGPLPDPGRSR